MHLNQGRPAHGFNQDRCPRRPAPATAPPQTSVPVLRQVARSIAVRGRHVSRVRFCVCAQKTARSISCSAPDAGLRTRRNGTADISGEGVNRHAPVLVTGTPRSSSLFLLLPPVVAGILVQAESRPQVSDALTIRMHWEHTGRPLPLYYTDLHPPRPWRLRRDTPLTRSSMSVAPTTCRSTANEVRAGAGSGVRQV